MSMISFLKHIEKNGLEDCVFHCEYKFKDEDESVESSFAYITIGGNGLHDDWEDDASAVAFDEQCVYHFDNQNEFLNHATDSNCDIIIIKKEK